MGINHEPFCSKCFALEVIDTDEAEKLSDLIYCRKCKKPKYKLRHVDFCEAHCDDAMNEEVTEQPEAEDNVMEVEDDDEEVAMTEDVTGDEEDEGEEEEEMPKKKKLKNKNKKNKKFTFATTEMEEETEEEASSEPDLGVLGNI